MLTSSNLQITSQTIGGAYLLGDVSTFQDRSGRGHHSPLWRDLTKIISMSGIEPSLFCGRERSSKELFEQLFNSYWEHLHDPATIFSFDFFCSVMLFPYSNVIAADYPSMKEKAEEKTKRLRRHKISQNKNLTGKMVVSVGYSSHAPSFNPVTVDGTFFRISLRIILPNRRDG
jgi:hypothetical protein